MNGRQGVVESATWDAAIQAAFDDGATVTWDEAAGVYRVAVTTTLPPVQRPERCPKCGNHVDWAAMDERDVHDPHCLGCGWRPTLDAAATEALERDFALPDGSRRQRRREAVPGGFLR